MEKIFELNLALEFLHGEVARQSFFRELEIAPEKVKSFDEFLSLYCGRSKKMFFRWLISDLTDPLSVQVATSGDSLVTIVAEKSGEGIVIKIGNSVKQEAHREATINIDFWDNFKKGFSDGVIFTDANGRVIEISDNTLKVFPIYSGHGVLLNREAVIGLMIREHFDTESADKLDYYFENSKTNRLASFNRTLEYKKKILEIKGYTIYDKLRLMGYMFLIFDISRTADLEKQLHETRDAISAKSHLVALGELAGKIAHEVNTPLGSILLVAGDAARLKPENTSIEVLQKKISNIEKTAISIAKIIKNLISFSRQDKNLAMAELDIKTVFDEVMTIAAIGMKRYGIKCKLNIPSDLFFEARKTQIQQVFLNLLSNSVAAIKHQTEKWIEVNVREIDGQLEIRLTDSGNGICEEIANKIMNQYSSTQELGAGLGIGLSVCKSVISGHNGTFELDRLCPNTSFIISIPKKQFNQ